MATWSMGFLWGVVLGALVMMFVQQPLSDRALSGIFTLLGVAAGGSLTIWYDRYKKQREKKQHKADLQDELKTNLHIIPKKRAILQKIIAALDKKTLLPGDSVRFCTTIFQQHFASVCDAFTLQERNCWHVIYEYFRVIDANMARYADDILAADHGSTRQVLLMQTYGNKLRDLDACAARTETLILQLQSGNPEDVLEVARPYSEVKSDDY